MRKAIVVGMLGVMAIGAAPARAACTGADVNIRAGNLPQARAAIRCLINARRADAGRAAFKHSPKLTGIARRHARRMRDEDFFGHTTPDGQTRAHRFAAAGYHHRGGENLAFGWRTPRILVSKWIDGGVHERNILSRRWRYIGIGIALGGSRKRLFVATFGPARS